LSQRPRPAAQFPHGQRHFGFRNDATGAREVLARTEAAGRAPQQIARERVVAELRHGDAAQRERRGVNWSIPAGLKNAIDWLSRYKEVPFVGKPVAIQSAAGGMLGGSRMQYHLRQSLTPLDVHLFGRPEVIISFAAQKFDESGKLKDQAAVDLIKQQLAGFEKYIRHLTGK
jgi:hypothetical protein